MAEIFKEVYTLSEPVIVSLSRFKPVVDNIIGNGFICCMKYLDADLVFVVQMLSTLIQLVYCLS